jgi:hypothetical protein
MIIEFEPVTQKLLSLVTEWETKLSQLSAEVISERRNNQNRTIKQIVGHMIDSASNNTHRIVHLQYQPSPYIYPDYANFGNNDKWIAIQKYQEEDWSVLVQLWKYSNIHIVHVIRNVNSEKLANEWISALNKPVSLKAMILGYLNHFELHLKEINDLIQKF